MTLDELILEYGTNKDLLDKTKKICDADNTAIKELMKGEFPKNTAVISFCSPRKTRRAEEIRKVT